MFALQTFALWAALASPGQVVLLDFYADWCGPCQAMEPTVNRLLADGYAVRKVNIDKEGDIVRQFGVNQVPTFIVLAGGREVQRVIGPVGYQQLIGMFEAAQPRTGPPAAARRLRHAAAAARGSPRTSVRGNAGTGVRRSRGRQSADAGHAGHRAAADRGSPRPVAGHGHDHRRLRRGALVMTCGHIFRDSQGQGTIAVDLFGAGAPARCRDSC